MPLDGSPLEQLTNSMPTTSVSTVLGPNGEAVYFAEGAFFDPGVSRVDLSTGTVTPLLDAGTGRGRLFGMDINAQGNRLVAVSNVDLSTQRRLLSIDTTSGAVTRLFDRPVGNISGGGWKTTPDKTRVVFIGETETGGTALYTQSIGVVPSRWIVN